MQKNDFEFEKTLEKDIDKKLENYITGQGVDNKISELLSDITDWTIKKDKDATQFNNEQLNPSNFGQAYGNLIKTLQTKFGDASSINHINDEDDEDDEEKKKPAITIEIQKLNVAATINNLIASNFDIDSAFAQIKFKEIEIKVLNNNKQYVPAQLKDDYKQILDDTIRSIVLFLYTREYYKNIKTKEQPTLVKARLVDCLFNMRVYLGMQFIFYEENGYNGHKAKDAIEYLQFIKYLEGHDLRQKYCEYICRYLNKYPECHSLLSQEKLEKLFDIKLTLDKNSIKLGDKIKMVDAKGQLIQDLKNFKEENPKAKISFSVIDSKPIVEVEQIEKEKNEIIVNENKENKENKEIEDNNNNDKKVNSNNNKDNKIEIPKVDEPSIDQLIETINKEAKLLEGLDKYVSDCLEKIDQYFRTADEFINFKRNKITEYLKATDKYAAYEFKEEDLDKLNNIFLSGKTAVNIVKKFNLKAAGLSNRLYSDSMEAVNKSVAIFKTLLEHVSKTKGKDEDVQFFPDDFYNFLYNNFAYSDSWLSSVNGKKRIQFSNDDIDNMLDRVNTNDKFLSCWNINHILQYLELKDNVQPSDKLIKFLLNSANLYSINTFVKIINSLSVGFGNIDKTLECIFDSQFDNSPFWQKLLQIEDIEQKLSPMEILKSSDAETKKFAFDLLENGIEIKTEIKDGKQKFVINKNAKKLQDFSEVELISCLAQEYGLNEFVRKHIADMINEKDKKLTDKELINARSDAINAFLNSSESLKRRYNKLLSKTDLLNNVKLLAETSVYCIDRLFTKLSNHEESDQILFQNWQFTEAKYKDGEISFNDFLLEHRSMRITKEYLDFCFKKNLINNTLNVKTRESLYQLLLALEDGNCTDELLKCFSSTLSGKKINFVDLICADQKTEDFDQCLANAIYQLIRTSPDYTDFDIGINNDKQIKAISKVLTNDGDKSDNYKWFRDGLFEWLKNQEKDIKDILKKNKDLDTMLSVCRITVGYDKANNQITCNNSNEIKDAFITADQILNLFTKSDHDTTVSLSEIKRIMKREEQHVEGGNNVVLPMDQNQQNSFMSLISEGRIVISTSKISELFDLENQVDDFFKTNDIARKLMWKIIDDELFDPKTGLFKRKDIPENEICQKYQDGLVDCLKKVKIVVGKDQKEITVDLSKFKDEFLSSVGIIKFDTLLEKDKTLFNLIKDGQFSISDRNFNGFLELFKAKFDKEQEQDGQQIISLFEQLTDKIEDFSLSYNNAQQLISTFLNQTTEIKFSQEDIDNFCSITRKLISKKLKLVNDGDDRSIYRDTAAKIFKEICKFFTNGKNEDKDASNIILILDSLIRKQDECYQCGKLIDELNDELNAICNEYKLNINDDKLQDARKLIDNKVMITDCHTKNLKGGYKFIIDFKSKVENDKKHLHIPLNVEYTDTSKNKKITQKLELYIDSIITSNNLKLECDIENQNSFDSVIEQITAKFDEDGKGDPSQEVINIYHACDETNSNSTGTGKPIRIDYSSDNFRYVVKSKSQKLSKNTLKNILTKIFEGKTIQDEKVFFDQFAPWFVHILSNYLDLSTLGDNDLSDLLEACIDKDLQFANKDACQSAKSFLEKCLKATMKNGSESCVNLYFIDSIISRIDPKCYFGDPTSDISCIFDFINENVGQIKIDQGGFSIYSLVLTIVKQMFSKKDDKTFIQNENMLLRKFDNSKKDILDKFNNSGLYILQKKFKQVDLVKSITDKSGNKFTIVITTVPETDGFIQQIRIDSGNYELTDKNQNSTEAKEKVENNIQIKSADKSQSEDAARAAAIITEKLKAPEQLQIKHKDEEEENEVLKKRDEDRNRKEQNSIDNVSFLTKLVNEEFYELVKSKFGVLDNNEIQKYEKFDDFLRDLEKMLNSCKSCKVKKIKENLLAKMKDFQSRIKNESLTFGQMTQFINLLIKIGGSKPSIDQFLSNWCNKYLTKDSKKSCRDDLYKYIKDKLQYSSETIENQLKILKFVIDNKEVIDVDDLKSEIQVFLGSGILSFKKKAYEPALISNKVVMFVDSLNVGDKNVKNLKLELQDVFFDYINKEIFQNDPDFHLETNGEKEEQEEQKKQAEKEKREKMNNEIEKKEDQDKIELEENYQKLKKNIEGFLLLGPVTSNDVKKIFEGIDIDFVDGAYQFTGKQRVLTEEKQEEINKFIDLLSQVNEKISQIKNDNNEGENNALFPSLENFFAVKILSSEQCITLVQFKVLSYPYVTGNLFTVAELRNLVEDYLQCRNDEKILATTMFQIIGKLKAHIDFGDIDEFFELMGSYHIKFNAVKNNNDRQAIIESINKHNILQLYIYADFKVNLKNKPKNQAITLETIKKHVVSLVDKVLTSGKLQGLDIDENNQLCYNANVDKVDDKRKMILIDNLTRKVIEQLCKDKTISDKNKNNFIQELNEQQSPTGQLPPNDVNMNSNENPPKQNFFKTKILHNPLAFAIGFIILAILFGVTAYFAEITLLYTISAVVFCIGIVFLLAWPIKKCIKKSNDTRKINVLPKDDLNENRTIGDIIENIKSEDQLNESGINANYSSDISQKNPQKNNVKEEI